MSDSDFVEEQLSRLENVQTRWSLLRAASLDGSSAVELRQALVLRYVVPIRSYIAAIVQDDNAADEIAQDAIVRMLQGDFAGADPDRGRFRDLLKTALRNMVKTHWKKAKVRQSSSLDFDIGEDSEANADDPWVDHWRKQLLEVAWSDLKQIEEREPNRFPWSVMKVRVDLPEADSVALASELGKRLGREVRPDAFRQQLKRARERFAETLIAELRDGLNDPDPQRVQDELIALGLYQWLKDKVADND